MTDLLGMRGTGDWSNEERPKNFRQGMLQIYPNGSMPITAVTSMTGSRSTDDPEYKWFSKSLETQIASLTGVYSDQAMANAKTGNGAAGDPIYFKMAAADLKHFRKGHTVLGINDSDTTKKVFGKVEAVVEAGADSYVHIKQKVAGNTMDNVNKLDIVGSAYSEGASIPDAISYAPSKFNGLTQIFRTPLDITRTMKKTRLYIGDAYKEVKRESFQYHGIEIEQAATLGEKSEVTGDNGKPERTTQGAIPFLNEHNSDNIINFPGSTAKTWKQAGEDWFDEKLEQLFRFGSQERMGVCGNGALLAIMKLVKQSGQIALTVETIAYGVKVMRWVTPFGEIFLKTSPLMTHKSYMTNDILFMDPSNVQFVHIDDTFFKADDGERKAGQIGHDGTKEEWLTEGGFEWHFPETMMYLTQLGSDGTAT
jgi:hypothetical protein